MDYDRKKKFIVNTIFFIIIAAILFFVVKYALSWLMPFVMAFVVATIVKPLSCKISKQFRVGRKFSACFCSFLFYAFAVTLIFLCGFGIFNASKNLLFNLPSIYKDDIEPAVISALDFFQETFDKMPISADINDITDIILANLQSMISSFSITALAFLSSMLKNVPAFFVQTLIAVISTFFISADYDEIVGFIMRQIPEKWHHILVDVKTHAGATVFKYLKSYSLIMLITFSEMMAALWLLRVENFFIISVIIAIFDILPVLGSGGILIPWAVISLVRGDYAFGIGMIIVYIIITIIRQIIEPKIIGEQVGLPPIVTLIAMFLGVKFMGIIGLFGFPITLVIIKKLNDSGKIHIFK